MAQQKRLLSALPEDPDLRPSTYMATCNHLKLQSQRIQYLLASEGTVHTQYVDITIQKIPIHVKFLKKDIIFNWVRVQQF